MSETMGITREDFNAMVIAASKKMNIVPRAMYHRVYQDIEKESGKNLTAMKDRLRLSMIDVIESENLFPLAAKICKTKYGVTL